MSRGPKTPEGKASSSQNARKNFLTAALLPGESRVEFGKILAAEVALHEPQNPVELQLVQKLALMQWKGLRLSAMQHAAHCGEIRNQEDNPPPVTDRGMAYRAYVAYGRMHHGRSSVELMHRHEMDYLRQYRRLMFTLIELKKKRENDEINQLSKDFLAVSPENEPKTNPERT